MVGFQKSLLVLACVGMIGSPVLAAERSLAPQTQTVTPTTQSVTNIVDVAMTTNSGIVGRFLDGEGHGIDGAVTVLSKGNKTVAQTTTDQQGTYQFVGLQMGTYQVQVGDQQQTIRIWDATAAPPSAHRYLTTIRGDQVVRGQIGGLGGASIVGGVVIAGAVVVAGVAYTESQDAKDETKKLKKQIKALMSP